MMESNANEPSQGGEWYLNALIVYGTRYGATAGTAEVIAQVLGEEDFNVQVVNAREEHVDDIAAYDLIIVGSGMKIDRWTKEPEQFLERFRRALAKKPLAIFVSSGVKAIHAHDGNVEALERARNKYLDDQATRYGVTPVATAVFGGVFPYDRMGWIERRTVGQLRRKYEAAGFTKTNGVYDTRDWDAIRTWTRDLARTVRT
jgi:menaquinone-dependent protoporphyrinogen oxidase